MWRWSPGGISRIGTRIAYKIVAFCHSSKENINYTVDSPNLSPHKGSRINMDMHPPK